MSLASLIFLHGFPFNKSSWNDQIEAFREDYDVHAPDLRGHGQADAPPGPWLIAHFAEDLKRYMDDHHIQKAVLCGLSMGGYVALHFISKYPERVQGLVLADTRADADSNEAKTKRFDTIEKLHREGMVNFAKDFSKSVLSEGTVKTRPAIQKRVEDMILGNAASNAAMVLAALASRHDFRSALSGIKCPTAVLVGSDDKVTPPELSELMAGAIEDSELHVIEGAGHLSNIEQPEIFNRFLASFLENNFSLASGPAVAPAH